MPEISAALVKELRDATNVGMMECKRALVDSDGDMEKATKLLRERGMAVAARKATRSTNQGLVASFVAEGGKTASLVEVNCETDFVARNENFKAFVDKIARQACASDATPADELKGEVVAKIAEIGENIVIRRHTRYHMETTGRIGSYIHFGGKVGVIVEVTCGQEQTTETDAFNELVKDLTLHITACNPKYLTSGDIPANVIASERDIYASQMKDKPPQVIDKIVDGKLRKFFAEVCLLDQGFVKEPKQSVTKLLAQKGKELSDTIAIQKFTLYHLGE